MRGSNHDDIISMGTHKQFDNGLITGGMGNDAFDFSTELLEGTYTIGDFTTNPPVPMAPQDDKLWVNTARARSTSQNQYVITPDTATPTLSWCIAQMTSGTLSCQVNATSMKVGVQGSGGTVDWNGELELAKQGKPAKIILR